MSNQVQCNGMTLTCTGVADAPDGHDRYFRVDNDEGNPIDKQALDDALVELFYQPSSGAGSQYCTFFNYYPHEYDDTQCVVSVQWRYDV